MVKRQLLLAFCALCVYEVQSPLCPSLSLTRFCPGWLIHPEPHPAQVAVKVTRCAVHVGGRYRKLRRDISNSPWIPGKCVTSVQEELERVVLPGLRADLCKFMSAGAHCAHVTTSVHVWLVHVPAAARVHYWIEWEGYVPARQLDGVH